MRSDEPLRPRLAPEMLSLEVTAHERVWLCGILTALTDRHSRYEPTALDAQRARRLLAQIAPEYDRITLAVVCRGCGRSQPETGQARHEVHCPFVEEPTDAERELLRQWGYAIVPDQPTARVTYVGRYWADPLTGEWLFWQEALARIARDRARGDQP